MKSLGKALFWIGFIVLIGVVMAYLIIMLAGALAFVTTTSVLTLCAAILIGAIFMLTGRSYERKGERKEEARRVRETELSAGTQPLTPDKQ
ncbi:MAG: hypothetical protein K2H88_07295 [Duncaniella sp.]|nr:hypothetical protein [Duncaniella sp.]MDE6170647.1 hypothetical protein [Duncaniella sp.]MDE6327935.1 hypothetical protein [Duncaniella sp.]MDE6465396.1 hypothetical protein [Duncaniella sp.]